MKDNKKENNNKIKIINNNKKNNILNTKTKKTRLYNTVFIYFILFTISIFLILFFMQIIFLKPMYKSTKEKQIKNFVKEIESDLKNLNSLNSINSEIQNKIDKIAYNNQIQVYIFTNELDLKYTSEENFNKMPQSILKEIQPILIKFQNNEISKDSYSENIPLKKFNSTVNLFIKKVNNNTNLIIISPIDQIDSTIEVLILQNQYMSIIAIIIAIIISIILSRKISLPIENITREAKLLEKGRYDLDIPETKYYETENLRNVLNLSAIKLKEKDTFQKNIIANVSHDLKTPLSIIKAYTEKIKDITGNNKEKREKDLNVISNETDKLSLLISNMLDLSKLDTGDYVLNKTNFNILQTINSTINRFKIICEDKNIKINLMLNNKNINKNKDKNIINNIVNNNELIILADELKISQVLYNLISNAVKYSNENSFINININYNNINNKNHNKTLIIAIQDFGKGIKKENLPYIFDKYYKSDDEEKENKISSTGLGLSIVKSILEKHNFEYGVKSKENKGSIFWFKI